MTVRKPRVINTQPIQTTFRHIDESSQLPTGDTPVGGAECGEKANCQRETLKRADKLERTVVKVVNKAKRRALKDETVDSAEALEAKLQAVLSSNDKIDRAAGKLVKGVNRKCAVLQVLPDTIFSGDCGVEAPDWPQFEACVIEAARREACLKINKFDGLTLDCGQADD